MCGFDDVRIHPNGDYYCSICGKELGPGFRDMAAKSLPPIWIKQLDTQAPPVGSPEQRSPEST